MRLHYLQHEPFENLAYIEEWALAKGYTVSSTQLYKLYPAYPDPTAIDWLVVLGGSMGVYEEERYPWLREEKEFIKRCIAEKKIILGICLGGQLLAEALGGSVRKNLHTEIGWFPVHLTGEGRQHPFFKSLPDPLTVFHWHGDTFELPQGAMRTAESEACANQAFVYGEKMVGLQFHFECSKPWVESIVRHGGDELTGGTYIQSSDEILLHLDEKTAESNRAVRQLLEAMSATL